MPSKGFVIEQDGHVLQAAGSGRPLLYRFRVNAEMRAEREAEMYPDRGFAVREATVEETRSGEDRD